MKLYEYNYRDADCCESCKHVSYDRERFYSLVCDLQTRKHVDYNFVCDKYEKIPEDLDS